jgi:hypothetical protein
LPATVTIKLIRKLDYIKQQYNKDNGIITYACVLYFSSVMSESLQKCSSEWCSLKQGLAYNLKFCCGHFEFVLPSLPSGILKIPDLSSCQGTVFSVLQGKFGWLAEGHGMSCGSGMYPTSCGVHVHNAATLSSFSMCLSQFSIYDQSECLHGHYRNYSLSEDDAYSLRYF